MRLATRLTLLITAVTLLVALSVGWFAIAMSSRAQYASLNDAINTVVDSGHGNRLTALTNALYTVQQNGFDLNLDVVFASGAVSQINTASVPLTRRPTKADVRASLGAVTTLAQLPGFEVRSLNVGAGDFLVVAGSTSNIRRQNQHLALGVGAASLAIGLVGVALVRVAIRRDLRSMGRLISYAGGLANGAEITPVPSGEGSRDIRELHAALIVMVQALGARIELEAKNAKIMQQFIDDASHELRTPLTVIKGYNELLAHDDSSSPQQRRAFERMRREISRMELLVGDLLLIAELREAPSHVEEVVDLSALVGERAGEFASDHPERDVARDIAPGVRVRGRVDYVHRLVVNALTNIARHTDAHDAVRITLRELDTWAELTIEDAGPGLPIYGQRPQRFQRFDESRSRDTGGSGLGMSIMADVAESMKGSLTTRPSELGGLAVIIDLPLEG
ncbi:MAG TPA: HAMP domain-containing sensor histidine kinase [Acidimicrobiales bacterium]|nr:HAMP domain-containing sensor histidine kinase [Acidimicrobiales bacterium]